ncbi:hypothetical protein K1719_027050 [Acacia pycnantha]|nr:hypothetical protein K1719_027050 [Acacia pycnantha]
MICPGLKPKTKQRALPKVKGRSFRLSEIGHTSLRRRAVILIIFVGYRRCLRHFLPSYALPSVISASPSLTHRSYYLDLCDSLTRFSLCVSIFQSLYQPELPPCLQAPYSIRAGLRLIDC